MVRDTSKEAYRIINERGLLSKQRLWIYQYLYHNGPLTARQIIEGMGIRANLTGRITELEEMGVFKKIGKVKDPVTKMTVYQYDVTSGLPEVPQQYTRKQKKDFIKARLKHIEPLVPAVHRVLVQEIIRRVDEL